MRAGDARRAGPQPRWVNQCCVFLSRYRRVVGNGLAALEGAQWPRTYPYRLAPPTLLPFHDGCCSCEYSCALFLRISLRTLQLLWGLLIGLATGQGGLKLDGRQQAGAQTTSARLEYFPVVAFISFRAAAACPVVIHRTVQTAAVCLTWPAALTTSCGPERSLLDPLHRHTRPCGAALRAGAAAGAFPQQRPGSSALAGAGCSSSVRLDSGDEARPQGAVVSAERPVKASRSSKCSWAQQPPAQAPCARQSATGGRVCAFPLRQQQQRRRRRRAARSVLPTCCGSAAARIMRWLHAVAACSTKSSHKHRTTDDTAAFTPENPATSRCAGSTALETGACTVAASTSLSTSCCTTAGPRVRSSGQAYGHQAPSAAAAAACQADGYAQQQPGAGSSAAAAAAAAAADDQERWAPAAAAAAACVRACVHGTSCSGSATRS